jgi:TolA-binding protein
MSKQTIALAAALALVGVSTGRAVDRVQTTAKEKPMVMGKIISISPQQIEVELLSSGGQTRQIPVNEIKEVKFEDEPGALFQARKAITDGEYGDALDKLGKLTPAETARRELATEIEYLKAYCAAELALSGNGDITEAGSQMLAFAKAHETSYHYLQACELIGNLLVAKGAYGQAEAYYRKLAEAPWPDYKMRAGIAMGRVMLAQGKAAEAAKAFDEVIASEAGGDLAEAQRMAAQVEKPARWPPATRSTGPSARCRRSSPTPTPTTRSCTPWPTTRWARPCGRPTSRRRPCWPSCTWTSCITPIPRRTPRRWPTWSSFSPSSTSPTTPSGFGRPSTSATRTATGPPGQGNLSVGWVEQCEPHHFFFHEAGVRERKEGEKGNAN